MDRNTAPTPFRLDARALAAAHASPCLALDVRALGGLLMLAPTPAAKRTERLAETVGVLDVIGPLQQRAAEHLCGVADGYDAIVARFAALNADETIGSIILRIDSPGGDAAGLLEAVRRMRELRTKPTLAYADELAASAAYAIATVAGHGIYLPPSGHVGSVGVVAVHVDESKALAEDGLNVSVFRSGTRKAEGLAFEPLSKVARQQMQATVDELAGQFADVVARARGMNASKVLGLEGALFMGEKAVAAGLADGVATWEQVVARARSAEVKALQRPPATSPATKTPTRTTTTAPAPRYSAAELREAGPIDREYMARVNAQDRDVARKLTELAGRPGAAARVEAAEAFARGDVYTGRLAQARAQAERLEARPAPTTTTVPSGQRYELLSFDALHNLRAAEPDRYDAMRADWERRGRPMVGR